MNKYLILLIAALSGITIGLLFKLFFGELVVTMDWLLAIIAALTIYRFLVLKKGKNNK